MGSAPSPSSHPPVLEASDRDIRAYDPKWGRLVDRIGSMGPSENRMTGRTRTALTRPFSKWVYAALAALIVLVIGVWQFWPSFRIHEFQASETSIRRGDLVTLTWRTSGADLVLATNLTQHKSGAHCGSLTNRFTSGIRLKTCMVRPSGKRAVAGVVATSLT